MIPWIIVKVVITYLFILSIIVYFKLGFIEISYVLGFWCLTFGKKLTKAYTCL